MYVVVLNILVIGFSIETQNIIEGNLMIYVGVMT